MAKLIPFRGILYNPAKVSGDEISAPPYDIITSEHRESLYQKNPYNIVRIDFGKEMSDDTENHNKYTRSRDYLEQWLKDGILITDDKPCFYAYEIDYELYGERKKLKGILALVKIEELGRGIYPHEATHSKPKADRLNLMRTCLANTSPIYSLYNSPEKITSMILNNIKEAPYFTASDMDGAVHKVYKISDEKQIDLIKRELSDKPIFIADGHHRYEVALEFKKEMNRLKGQGEWDYVMMFLANMADEGITILPTHRLVKGLDRNETLKKLEHDFNIRQFHMDADIASIIYREGKNTFGLYLDKDKQWYILKYRKTDLKDVPPALRELDVVVLHELIFKKILKMGSPENQRFSGAVDVTYEMNVREAIGRVRKGDFDAVFFLNPTGVDDVERVALSNLRMPPKSTYFYPKLLTGMVINKFGEP